MREENRTEKREIFTVTVDYCYSSVNDSRLKCEVGTAVTSNISHKGIGFYTNRMFEKGHDIKLFSKHISDGPVSAVVRWCNRVSENFYKVGLMFVNPPLNSHITADA